MSLLVVLIVLALAIYAVREFPIPAREGQSTAGIRSLIVVVLIVIAIVFICQRADLLR